jgi:hypothetical protein
MADVPTTEPTSVTAGDTLTWRRSLPDYPASAGWVLSYALANADGLITITATADGDDHLVSVAAATSAGYLPGEYAWQSYVTKSADRYMVDRGALTILPNLATQGAGFDLRTPTKVALDKIDAWLSRPDTLPFVSEYEIAGRRMKYADVLAMRSKLVAELTREGVVASGTGTRLVVRF